MQNETKFLDKRKEISQKLKQNLIESLDIAYSPEDLNEDISLIGSGLSLDSLDILEIVICVENIFGIKLPEASPKILRSFNTIVDYIMSQTEPDFQNLAAQNENALEKESPAYKALRESVLVSDFSKLVKKFSLDEMDGVDYLDTVLPANILKLRYGKILNTFVSSKGGEVLGECFLANIDNKLFALIETEQASEISDILDQSKLEDITESYALINIDGPLAWKVVHGLFGSDIVNLSYLSVEQYEFENRNIYLLRNGKTGEFGYQILAEAQLKDSLLKKITDISKPLEGLVLSNKEEILNLHGRARLEGNFFNIFAEGKLEKNPISLGLQWMIDFNKESFAGSKIIFNNRNDVSKAPIAIVSDSPFETEETLLNNDLEAGKILSTFKTPEQYVGLAIVDRNLAYPQVDFVSQKSGAKAASISRPSIYAKSIVNGMEGI